MLLTLVTACAYFGILLAIPIGLTLLGGFIDVQNRSVGDIKNDIPSTVGFVAGIIIDLYILTGLWVLVPILLIFLIYQSVGSRTRCDRVSSPSTEDT